MVTHNTEKKDVTEPPVVSSSTKDTTKDAPPTPTPLAAQAVNAASPKFEFFLTAGGNMRVRLIDTQGSMGWQSVISAANWALLAAISGSGSYMQFSAVMGGTLPQQSPA